MTNLHPACQRCRGTRGDPDVRYGLCGTCAQDLLDQAAADAADPDAPGHLLDSDLGLLEDPDAPF